MIQQLLRIDTRPAHVGSTSRQMGDRIEQRLRDINPKMQVVQRELSEGLPWLDEQWIQANMTAADERSASQQAALTLSDELVSELIQADGVLMTVPMHNFSVPGVLKAWVDLICRAGVSFRYTAQGPLGLLADRPVYLVQTSGGVPVGDAADFLTPYLAQVLNFVGISDIRLIAADRTNVDREASEQRALQALAQWLPEASQSISASEASA